MNVDDIKLKITELASEHHSLDIPTVDEIQFAEMIEEEVTGLIVSYCEYNGYMINSFPAEKRALFEKQELVDGEEEETYFCQERFQLYLDYLVLEKDDVSELLWFYNKSFWPDSFETKESFLELIKQQIQCGYYEINL
ncbi:MAG TPA: hypothetical protein PKJ08_12680 [Candidatus Cloacimonadota bacterium]|nr:hypothetical protein [Candidatus Cloacimonadota bacterium]